MCYLVYKSRDKKKVLLIEINYLSLNKLLYCSMCFLFNGYFSD